MSIWNIVVWLFKFFFCRKNIETKQESVESTNDLVNDSTVSVHFDSHTNDISIKSDSNDDTFNPNFKNWVWHRKIEEAVVPREEQASATATVMPAVATAISETGTRPKVRSIFRDKLLAKPKFQSTPRKMSGAAGKLDKMDRPADISQLGTTISDILNKESMLNQDLENVTGAILSCEEPKPDLDKEWPIFDIDYSDLVGRPARHRTLASEWRLEEAGCNTIRVVKGQSLETQIFDPERNVVLNTSGFQVSTPGPGLIIRNQLSKHLSDHPMTRLVGLDHPTTGISIPVWVEAGPRGNLLWYFEPVED
jgi:hypothetical protein